MVHDISICMEALAAGAEKKASPSLSYFRFLVCVCVYTFLGELVSNLLNLNSPNS